jgi:hypothetical protein
MRATLTGYSSYGDGVAQQLDRWPDAGHALLHELSTARGLVGLISADTMAAADHLVERLMRDLRVTTVSLGRALAASSAAPTTEEIEQACSDATVITDIDMLFWPSLHVPVLPFLRKHASQQATIAVWPGEISGGRALYSAPGRQDHYDVALHNAIVLRPRHTRFPDELPFVAERILP